jgi:hypothetical protein
MLMEKALSNQSKTNSLEQITVPLEDAASKQLDARDVAAIAEAVKAKASAHQAKAAESSKAEAKAPAEAAAPPVAKLDIKA